MIDETEEERSARLKQFVVDYLDHQVFTSLHVDRPEDIRFVFMVLSLYNGGETEEERSAWRARLEDTGLLWEYYRNAGPRGFNGYPIFWSVRLMSKADWERVRPVLEAELARREAIKV